MSIYIRTLNLLVSRGVLIVEVLPGDEFGGHLNGDTNPRWPLPLPARVASRDRGRQAMCSSIDVTWLTGEARRVMAIAFGCGVGELENGDVRTTEAG